MKHLLIAVVLIACVPNYTPSQKEPVTVGIGFMKGKDYLDLDSGQKRAYAMGVINGILVAPLLGAPDERMAWVRPCTEKMDAEQVAAIITKFVRDNPAEWHHGMNLLSLKAIMSAC